MVSRCQLNLESLNNMEAISRFNIYFIPERATLALAGLGAATVLVFRRRE